MNKLKTKTIPCLIMLIGGAATLAITYYQNYSSRETLEVLLISLLACYFVGTLVKTALDRIELPIPEEIEAETKEEDLENEFFENDSLSDYDESFDGSDGNDRMESSEDDFWDERYSSEESNEFVTDNDLHGETEYDYEEEHGTYEQ